MTDRRSVRAVVLGGERIEGPGRERLFLTLLRGLIAFALRCAPRFFLHFAAFGGFFIVLSSSYPSALTRDWMWKYHGRRGSVSDITKNGAFCDRVQRKGRLGLQPTIEIPRLN